MLKKTGGRVLLSIFIALIAVPSFAGESEWKIWLEPMYMNVHGHDQHVLTITEFDGDPMPVVLDSTAVNLDVDNDLAYRIGLEYRRGEWGWGLDITSFMTQHARKAITGAADDPAGTIDQVDFMIANRSYASGDPTDVLYYNVLEDTDLQMWTADIYGSRALADGENGAIRMRFGVRVADFDNDYHAVVGVEGAFGSHIDASSNYSAMHGLMVGLSGDLRRGRQTINGSLGQSLVFGEAGLFNTMRDYMGPVDAPIYTAQFDFLTIEDVAIPITEFRLKWSYRLNEMIAVGAGANSSVWWDVQVPPGVVPGFASTTLHENTIVFFGMLVGVELTF